jgi:hypothetical protein
VTDGLDLTQVGYGSGWAIVAVVVLMIFRGLLVTRREADSYLTRAESAEANNVKLIAQNGELMEMARLGQAMFQALKQGAEGD